MAEADEVRANGASLLQVPCVQELAKQALSRVPERYLRTDVDDLHLHLHLQPNTCSPQVPLIDLSKLLSADFHASELHNLHSACKHWGFFQLINHGVDSSLVENVKKGAESFFNLPIEEKSKFRQRAGEREGYGQLFVVSEEQKLEWADVFAMVTLPPQSRKPHLFPNIPFRDDLDAYCMELKNLAVKMLEFMGEALNMEAKEVRELFEEGRQTMRMNYYPPCPQPQKVIGLSSHSDIAALTILLQVSEVQGLQVKRDGKWVPIAPIPNAFVVNLGDTFEIVSNGIYRSVEHRATVNSEKERISIATFYSVALDKYLRPSPSLVTPETPALFRRIQMFDFQEKHFSRKLDGKSQMDFVRIQNQNGEFQSEIH